MKEDPIAEVERAMKREGRTQSSLEREGFSRGALSRIFRRLRSPRWVTIQKIAKALGYRAYVAFRKEKK